MGGGFYTASHFVLPSALGILTRRNLGLFPHLSFSTPTSIYIN
jgi:hypothetical protein